MWPRKPAVDREYLRVGRHAVERWVGPSSALTMAARCDLVQGVEPEVDQLKVAIAELYVTAPTSPVTMLLETAWLPMVLVDVGSLWSESQINGLLSHRLSLMLGQPVSTALGWLLRMEHLAGERFALGYALSPQLQGALPEIAQAVGLTWAAWLPAFAWGVDHLTPRRTWPAQTGWWAWPEQDRLIIAGFEQGRVVALNSGSTLADDPGQIARLMTIESVRAGMPRTDEPQAFATWLPSPTLKAIA